MIDAAAEQHFAGRSSAWLERLVWDQEAGGSNPLAPIVRPLASALLSEPTAPADGRHGHAVMPEQSHLPPEIGLLRGDVADMLAWVEPSTSYAGVRYYPCEATTVDGCVHPRVFVVDALSYIREVGVWPWVDRGKQWVRAESIVALRSSSVRLPAIFANVLNAAGESGMGYCAFSVDLRDGRRLYFVTGNAVDFPDWPDGVTPLDVVAVWPHDRGPEHRHRAPRHHESTAEYAWAPFRSPE